MKELENIRSAIGLGKIEVAIDQFFGLVKSNESGLQIDDYRDELISIKGRFTRNEELALNSLIKHEDRQLENNRISKALIKLLSKWENEVKRQAEVAEQKRQAEEERKRQEAKNRKAKAAEQKRKEEAMRKVEVAERKRKEEEIRKVEEAEQKRQEEKRKQKQRKEDWEKTKAINTIDGYEQFVNQYETGKYIHSAKKNIKELQGLTTTKKAPTVNKQSELPKESTGQVVLGVLTMVFLFVFWFAVGGFAFYLVAQFAFSAMGIELNFSDQLGKWVRNFCIFAGLALAFNRLDS